MKTDIELMRVECKTKSCKECKFGKLILNKKCLPNCLPTMFHKFDFVEMGKIMNELRKKLK